jgi:riboflavin transporter
MKNQFKKNRELAIFSSLVALSAVFQLLHIGIKTQWGMWIDIVAVPWIIAYFLFDLKGGLIVSLVGSIIITLFTPDTWLGASAKFLATVPMFLVFHLLKTKINKYKNIIIPTLLALIIRGIVMFFFNYYFALRIWIPGKTPIQLMNMFPWYIIIGINAVQGILDVLFAWIIVFKYKLIRFGDRE